MSYFDGFVLPVPASNKQAYLDHATQVAPLFREFGVARCVDAWEDDVPDGKLTDFRRAVDARKDEVVVFGWFEHPSREARDAAGARMMSDPRMEAMGAAMPFDGKRMIFGGFEPLLDEGEHLADAYVDGFLVPVPEGKKDEYRAIAEQAAAVFRDHGASRVVEAWGNDVPEGKVTDYRRAVKAAEGEAVVFSWIEWPSREARDAGMKRSMEDPRMRMDHENMPFDGKRMVFGGFRVLAEG